MKFMWADFMLDDPRMTNSTFNEGYDVSGALHYPAYSDDARISHAHGWSTGPLIALSQYAAGLHVVNSTTWLVHPQPGNLSEVEAGFTTAIGTFAAAWTNTSANGSATYSFQTPPGTQGSVVLDVPGCSVNVRSSTGYLSGTTSPNGTVSVPKVAGGNYVANIQCMSGSGTVTPSTGDAASISPARMVILLATLALIVAIK